MIKDGSKNGSSPESIDAVLSRGFDRKRTRLMIVCDAGPLVALSNERDAHYFTANKRFR